MQARRTKVLVWASFLALVLNTLLNFALIPGFGMYGAAYATFGAYVVEAVVMYFLAQRMFRLNDDLPRVFASAAILAIVILSTQVRWPSAYRAEITAAVGSMSLALSPAWAGGAYRLLLRLERQVFPLDGR